MSIYAANSPALRWLEKSRTQPIIQQGKLPGLTGCSEFVQLENGERYVLRQQTKRANSCGVNYQQEFELLDALTPLGIAPQPLYCGAGQTLLSWLEGEVPPSFTPVLLLKLAQLLSRLHRLPLQAVQFSTKITKLNLAERCQFLWDQLDSTKHHQLAFKPPFDEVVPFTQTICHHDIHLANLIEQNGRLYLIDWEYAAISDPALDIAMLFQANDLNNSEQHLFLDAYLAHTQYPQPQFETKIQQYLPEVHKLSLLWYAL